MLKGQLSVDTPMAVLVTTIWEVLSGLEIGRLVNQLLSDTLGKVEVLEGDGSVGTIIKVTFAPGTPGPSYMLEKITKVDHENRVKETEVIEGGYKALGFDFVGARFEVLENDSESSVVRSSIVRSSIVYEVDEKLSDLISKLSTKPLELIIGAIDKHLSDTVAASA